MAKIEEIWKDIAGYKGFYKVSILGMVMRSNTGRILKHRLCNGYRVVHLSKKGQVRSFRICRLVAITWIKNPLNKEQVNHKNGIKIDDRVINLEWSTQGENNLHSFRVLHRSFKKRPIIQMDLQGNVLMTHESLSAADRSLNIGQSRGAITSCCKGELRTSHGYKWAYVK